MRSIPTAASAAIFAAASLAAACGDNSGPATPADADEQDASRDPDAASPDPDAASPDPDAAPHDALPPPTGVPTVIALSATGTDGFFGVASDAAGNFYAVGVRAAGIDAASDRAMVVAKFLPNGTLDTGFGTDGLAVKNVAVGGGNGESARGIVIQPGGKIVIGGAIEHNVTPEQPVLAADRDVALVRFNPDGTVDRGFGTDGVVLLDLNSGLVVPAANPNDPPTLAGADQFWSLGVYPDGRLLVHGAQRTTITDPPATEGGPRLPRRDTDWAMVRLTADGAVDGGFATGGKFTLDIQGANASARTAAILPDGSLIGAGYANTPGLMSTQPVVYKLTADGALDQRFGTGGIFHEIVLAVQAEAYGVAVQGDKLVTTGYGRNSGTTNDWVSIRLDASGALDRSWGQNGVVTVDVAGFGDNSRYVLGLPDRRIVLVGGGAPAMGQSDAMLVVLTENGAFDDSFAPAGRKLFDLGGPSDFFWAGALSPDGKRLALAGLKGAGSSPTAESNDDAAILVLQLAN